MSLEGWTPQIGPYLTLEEVIEHAFDYRGNITVGRTDGTDIVGYLFNRNASAPESFVEIFDEAGEGPIRIRCADIATITFTGKDTAPGPASSTSAGRDSSRVSRPRSWCRQASAEGSPRA